jgi:Carboxypeptidase regulatory-like domain
VRRLSSRIARDLAVIFTVAASIATPARSQTPPAQAPTSSSTVLDYRHRLVGVFSADTGEPIEGAEVVDLFAHNTVRTTKTGTVTLSFLPEGGSMIRVQKLGYQPVTMVVAVSPSDTVPLTIVLTSAAQTLPKMTTTDSAPRYLSPGLRDFEERRAKGFGYFIPEADLRKADNSKMTNVIRRLPNIHIICPRTGTRRGECYPTSMRQPQKYAVLGGECPLDIYVDGAASTDNDLEKMRVNDYAGIEYYAGGGTIPVQYNRTGSSCGVLLFWTRER